MKVFSQSESQVKIGQVFSRLRVEGPEFVIKTRNSGRPRSHVVASCECGTIRCVTTSELISGHTRSCGCFKSATTSIRMKSHGDSKKRLYRIWSGMISRCKYENRKDGSSYKQRGILVCKSWAMSYESFREWSMSSGYKHNLTIDRIDNDGNYEPSNCRWTTEIQQARNTRRNRRIHAFGESKLAVEWADDKRCVVSGETLHSRVFDLNWDHETAITKQPRMTNTRRKSLEAKSASR